MDDLLRCAFCGVEIDPDAAIEEGWTPYFFWLDRNSGASPGSVGRWRATSICETNDCHGRVCFVMQGEKARPRQ